MDYNNYVLARVLHVCAVVLWIGGVAFVTTVLIPALRSNKLNHSPMQLFEMLEGKFALQAKVTTVLVGLSGAYMLEVTAQWGNFLELRFWWLHLMVLVWSIFTIVLFILEPWFLHHWFKRSATLNSEKTLDILQWMHRILLAVSLLAVAGAVAGAHGFMF